MMTTMTMIVIIVMTTTPGGCKGDDSGDVREFEKHAVNRFKKDDPVVARVTTAGTCVSSKNTRSIVSKKKKGAPASTMQVERWSPTSQPSSTNREHEVGEVEIFSTFPMVELDWQM